MVNQKQKITEIIKNNPKTMRVFYKEKFDFCFDADITLENFCMKHNKSIPLIMSKLENTEGLNDVVMPLLKMRVNVVDVIDFVLKRFHEPLKKEMDSLQKLITKVEKELGNRYLELLPLKNYIIKAFEDLRNHMIKEELNLFPLIKAVERGGLGDCYLGDLKRPVWEMELEHENSLRFLKKIRWYTNDYNMYNFSKDLNDLYAGLDKLEFDLYLHIYLENTYIHPAALSLRGLI